MILQLLPWPGPAGIHRENPGRSFLVPAAESVFLTSAFLAACIWLRPSDPFFLSAHFPWIWLVPLLAALRYGSAGAILSSLVLVAGWNLAGALDVPLPKEYPKGYFLGGFIASLVCGEFRDLWRADTRREKKSKEHLETRLDALSAAYQVMALSHDRLMADFITHPPTLRDALAEVPRPRAGTLDAGSAQALLVFLARFFHLETAALHLMEPQGLRAAPLAALGPARSLDGGESLVAACLRTGALCHALSEGAEAPAGPYLFAAPLVSGAAPVSGPGAAMAVLVAEKMPFFAFQEENLRGLYAALGYYSDLLQTSALASRITSGLPDCPEDFAAGYLRLHRLNETAGVPSALAARVLPGIGGSEEWMAKARAAGRGADLFWHKLLPQGGSALIALLPFCGEDQGRAFLARLDDGGPESRAGGRVAGLFRGEPMEGLERFLAGLGEAKGETSEAPAQPLRTA